MFEGDNHSDACYAVAGDILDGYLYDLFMNMLAERGVDADFADELSEWCSSHEHGQYINMLSELEKWSKLWELFMLERACSSADSWGAVSYWATLWPTMWQVWLF